jgi:uncharacterized protein YyaL (SSP411 family)
MASHNSLEHAASAYLRSAMHQPIQWHEWGEEAFAAAAKDDKPILLDIGAVWCHWCHVMDRESYENPTLAEVINQHFIAVKVDRDERPDVDARYQAAVQAISGQGGWPLTAILTPDGRPFFGGTYFPNEDRYGRPGFQRVLLTLADVWKNRRDEALETAASVLAAIEHGESFSGGSASLSLGIVDKLVESVVRQFDPRHGGFGSQPKFPHPAALDLLIDTAARTGNEEAKKAATVTLTQMAHGGIYDHLAGGFHRYSVDEQWIVPHFEKMLYDNAALLANYVHAFQTFVDPLYANLARDIMRWMDEWLTDRESGGFYASQDADLSLDDDGDYFTWTRDEAAEVLTTEELEIAALWYDIGELGDMHHNPKKNVLHVRYPLVEIARRAARDVSGVERDLRSAKQKLYAARLKRLTPFIDKTLYSGWNAMAISAYLEAASVLNLEAPRTFALKILDRILRDAWNLHTGLAHVIAYSGNQAAPQRIPGVLDDYAFLVHACIDAWQATGDLRYYNHATQLAETMIARFHDTTGGGFYDTENSSDKKLGALTARRKPMQDSPTPAGNPTAAAALLRLEALSGRKDFAEKAEDTLESFAGVIEQYGLYAGSYGLALDRLLLPPIQIVIVGDNEAARNLAAAATARYAVNKSIIQLQAGQIRPDNLPSVLAETLPNLPDLLTRAAEGFAMVCKGTSCLPPTGDVDELLNQINSVA